MLYNTGLTIVFGQCMVTDLYFKQTKTRIVIYTDVSTLHIVAICELFCWYSCVSEITYTHNNPYPNLYH